MFLSIFYNVWLLASTSWFLLKPWIFKFFTRMQFNIKRMW